MDLPPLDPCPAAKRHALNVILPEESDGDMTLFCERCGALRRVPVSGAMLPERMDDLTSEELEALTRR